MSEKNEELSVEAILEELSDIADELENGDLPLDKALSLFEKGVQLSAQGTKRLTTLSRNLRSFSNKVNAKNIRSKNYEKSSCRYFGGSTRHR